VFANPLAPSCLSPTTWRVSRSAAGLPRGLTNRAVRPNPYDGWSDHRPSGDGPCAAFGLAAAPTRSKLSPHDGRALAQRAEFGEGNRARQILHAAIGRRDQFVMTDEL